MSASCQTGETWLESQAGWSRVGWGWEGTRVKGRGGVIPGTPKDSFHSLVSSASSCRQEKERTENMLIKSASGTQFGRVAKIL